jgi:hypothetical protein
MWESEEREGKPVYKEGPVEIRTFPNGGPDEHNVWIGENYFLFQRGILDEISIRTNPQRLEEKLDAYDYRINCVLKQEKITPQGFGLILAHASISELNKKLREAYDQINNLSDTYQETLSERCGDEDRFLSINSMK